MKNRTRERALRVMAGALLSSDLSRAEITALGRALREDSQVAQDLGHLLEHIVGGIEPSRALMKAYPVGSHVATESAGLVEEIMTVLKKRRKAKRVVVAWLQGLGDGYVGLLNPAWTLREIVTEFVGHAAPGVLVQLQKDLGLEGSTVDPYLKGIMKKQER